jgi:hypothetical protein
MKTFALISIVLCAACGADSKEASLDAPKVGADAPAAMTCTVVGDCTPTTDCRCKNSIHTGASCKNGSCEDRAAVCNSVCASSGGWVPNVANCWDWDLYSGNAGTIANYQGYTDAECVSGVHITIGKPGSGDYQWCVPTKTCDTGSGTCIAQCTSDADCPTTGDGKWTCAAEVSNRTNGNKLRLCNPPLGANTAPFCNMFGR